MKSINRKLLMALIVAPLLLMGITPTSATTYDLGVKVTQITSPDGEWGPGEWQWRVRDRSMYSPEEYEKEDPIHWNTGEESYQTDVIYTSTSYYLELWECDGPTCFQSNDEESIFVKIMVFSTTSGGTNGIKVDTDSDNDGDPLETGERYYYDSNSILVVVWERNIEVPNTFPTELVFYIYVS